MLLSNHYFLRSSPLPPKTHLSKMLKVKRETGIVKDRGKVSPPLKEENDPTKASPNDYTAMWKVSPLRLFYCYLKEEN